MTEPEKWYRVESRRYAVYDEYGDSWGFTPVKLVTLSYDVVKHTPKGVRLDIGRFVLHEAKKQWASPTLEAAMNHFAERRKAEIRILKGRLSIAERALELSIAGRDAQEI